MSGALNHINGNSDVQTDFWHSNSRLFLYILGTVQLLAGAIFFFAYNWDGLDKWLKFALIGGAEFLAFILWWRSKTNSISFQAFALTSFTLIGVFLAVFGQIYQTGADAYELFMVWTLFGGIFMLAANSTALTIAWTLVAYTASSSFMVQAMDIPFVQYTYLLALLYTGIFLILFGAHKAAILTLRPFMITTTLIAPLIALMCSQWISGYQFIVNKSFKWQLFTNVELAVLLIFMITPFISKKLNNMGAISTLYAGMISIPTSLICYYLFDNSHYKIATLASTILFALATYLFTRILLWQRKINSPAKTQDTKEQDNE